MRIAAFIPVYQHPKFLADIVGKLLDCHYPQLEVTVVVDGQTTVEIEAAVKRFDGTVHVHRNGHQAGKAVSLNGVALDKQADVLLFLDNDVLLPSDPSLLQRLAAEMERHEVAELPKEAMVSSLISAMMSYEYLCTAVASYAAAGLANRFFMVAGAGFAVRAELFRSLGGFRRMVHEDMDFGARAFQANARFSFSRRLKIGNEVPTTIREWFRQRKRWALGYITYLRNHFLMILKGFFKHPGLLLSILPLLLPLVAYVVLFLLLRDVRLTFLLPTLYMVTQSVNFLTGVLLWLSHAQLFLSDGLLPSILAACISVLTFAVFARILRFRFRIWEFLFFYVVYAPIWLIGNLVVLLIVLFRGKVDVDWKV